MSSCIKDFYDYELVKKGCKYGIICLESKFQKKNLSDGKYNQCRSCGKLFFSKNKDRIEDFFRCLRSKKKEYQLKNHGIFTHKKLLK